jgi:hypothetical protein
MNGSKHPLLLRYQEHLNTGSYHTTLEILDALRTEGWHFDIGSEMLRVILGNISPEVGIQILISNQYSDWSAISDYSFINPATGNWMHIKKALSASTIKELSVICDQCFPSPGIPPRPLQTSAAGQEAAEFLAKLGIMDLLQTIAREVQPDLGHSLTILGARTLLRRTYPIRIEYKDPSRNMHNQDWHQDSNPAFGTRPMLTVWIPLQSESGISRPGISIMKAPINRFHPDFGDGCVNAKAELEEELGDVEIETPLVDAGDAVVFNGLTFHQTFATEEMLHHRDVLLIRIVRSHEAGYFPADHKNDVVVRV